MRRLLTILLLAVCGLPLVAPLLALRGVEDAAVPACCRRGGLHHCLGMGAAERESGPGGVTISSVCEFGHHPAGVGAALREMLQAPVASARGAAWVSPYTVGADTASKQRLSRCGSRLQRGPPSLIL